MALVQTFAALYGATFPLEVDVRELVAYTDGLNDYVGVLSPGTEAKYPAQSDVRLGTVYGDSDQFTGNLVLPATSDVLVGVQYGSFGNEFTGTLNAGNPDIEDVRLGVTFGLNSSLVGVLESPAESKVLAGIGYGAYGTEFEGTLTDIPGGGGTLQPPVRPDGGLRSPLVIGDSYTGSRRFEWTLDDPGMNLGSTTAKFRGWSKCCCECPSEYDWSVDGTVTEADGVWTVAFEMDASETSVIDPDEYNWDVEITDGTLVYTIAGSFLSSLVQWIC